MTGEEFRARYKLGERLTEPPVVSHRAAEESGAPVLVHFLVGFGNETGESLLAKVQGADTPLRDHIQDIGEVDGVPVVVTDVPEGFSSLTVWLESAARGPATPGPEEAKEPGAYTRLFRVSEMGLGASQQASAAPPPPKPEASPPAPPTPEASRSAPSPADGPPLPEPEAPPAAPPPPAEKKAPGSYTMLFGTGAAATEEGPPAGSEPPPQETAPPAAVVTPAPTPAEPQAPPHAPPPPIPTPLPGPPAAPPGPPPTGGAAVDTPSAPPLPPEKEKKEPGSYTMLFGTGGTASPGPSGAPAPDTGTTPPAVPPPSASRPDPTPPTPAPQAAPPGPGSGATFGFSPPAPRDTPEPAGPNSATGFLGQVEDRSAEVEAPEPLFPRLGPQAPPPPPLAEGPTPTPPPASPTPSQQPGSPQPPAGGMMGGDAAPPPTPKEKSGKPGAYTQIFGGRGAGSDRPASSPPRYTPPPPPPPPAPTPGPGPLQPPQGQGPPSPEWQRWKDTPGAAGRHIPSDDYLQRLSGAPDPFHPPPPQTQAPSEAGQKGPIISGPLFSGGGPAQSGPGHYTMVREGLSSDPRLTAPGRPKGGSPAPAGAEPSPAPGPSKGSKLGTILGLIAVLLAIVAVVVVLILTS